MARPRRALARRAKRLLGYWRSERRTLRQGLVALALSTVAGFIAGLTLASITGTLAALPGLLVLIPASVGMRGTVFGAMGARLATATHAGTFEVTLARGSVLRRNVEAGVASSILSSFYLAVMAKLVASAFSESTISLWDMVTISVIGGTVGSAVILFVTVGLAAASHRRGWDLDAVSTPMVTAIGDMVTLPTLFLATLVVRHHTVNAIIAGACTVLTVAALLWIGVAAEKSVRRILAEMVPMILLVPVLDVLAGALLEARRPSLVAAPALLILIPPFVSQAGAVGGILSSRLSSKLQLGVITPRGRPEPPALVDGTIAIMFGVAVFTLIGLAGTLVAVMTGVGHPGVGAMTAATLFAGLLALPVLLVVAYYVAVATARFGLDPDNSGVPTLTSLMDLVGVACLLFVLSVSGVLSYG
ncbi:MAG: magnesium transporter [Actinomycetota bacterium]